MLRCLQVSARLILALWLALAPVKALAGPMTLLGAGKAGAAAAYAGPGDAVSGATAFYSCARVYSLSVASTSTNLCDLVAVTGGAAVCTLRGSASGFVDLSAYCPGSLTPAAACAAASGGSCKVTKVYNQVSAGTNDMTQATLANMPAISFSAVNSLPAISFTSGSSQVVTSTSTFTQAAPFGLSAVFKRTANTSGGYISAVGINAELRGSASADTMVFSCGTNVSETATDNAWHAANAACSNVANSGAISVGASDFTGLNTGTNSLSSNAIRMGESNSANFLTGLVAEAIFYPFGPNATQRGALYTNQNSANGYNGAL